MARTGPVSRAVTAALKDAPLLPRDQGGVALAKVYARAIDDDTEALASLGPKLLAVLSELGMTPAGRGVKAGGSSAPVAGKLDELRKRRAARAAGQD